MCVHHWILETPDGPTGWGECKLCHERKEHSNSIPDSANWFSPMSAEEKEAKKNEIRMRWEAW